MAAAAHIDFETRSALDLRRCGLYRYAEHPSTFPWMMWWRLDDGDVQEWRPGWPDPKPLLDHVASGGVLKAHNVAFERQIWNITLLSKPEFARWPRLEITQCDCSMARALAIHLPAELGMLTQALGLGEGKSESGRAVMLKMSKPRKRNPDGTFVWWDDPKLLYQLGQERCRQDVLDECAVDAKLPPLSKSERMLWELDQRINDRGVAIDLNVAEKAIAVLEIARQRADARMSEITRGAVKKCTESGKIVEWLKSRGVPSDSIAKAEHSELMAIADLLGDATAREVINLRAESARISTAKFRRMTEVACDDGRARGLLQFHRGHTGRWGGELVQPHNFTRVDEMDLSGVLAAIEIMEAFS